MNQELLDSQHVKPTKIKKTINIDAHISDRLIEVCDYLGVTPHAYLVARVGECVSRDYVQFQVGKSVDINEEMLKLLASAFSGEKSTKED